MQVILPDEILLDKSSSTFRFFRLFHSLGRMLAWAPHAWEIACLGKANLTVQIWTLAMLSIAVSGAARVSTGGRARS